jgi:predicted nucleotidyltransferase
MPTEPPAALRREVPALLRQRLPGLFAVVHFGSSSEPKPQIHRDSDVDLAVLGTERYGAALLHALAGECASLLNASVDLVDLRAADTVFAMQILGSGRLILDLAPMEFARFENRRCSEYLAFNEERREILADIVARGAVYG